MKLLHQIEKALDQRLRAAFGGRRENAREAIELYREALEEISSRTTPGLRGSPVFPFNRIVITLKAENSERRAVLETIFAPREMVSDIVATLGESGASGLAKLALEVGFQADQTDEMEIAFDRVEMPVVEETPGAADAETANFVATTFVAGVPVRLITLAGASSNTELVLEGNSVHIGRGPDVIDTSGRTVRRNGLFFSDDALAAESAAINATVSRAHAHLILDVAFGGWRLFDDGSSFGTSVFRHGRRLEVPAHGSRGVRLQTGDEIWLGHACLRFEAGE